MTKILNTAVKIRTLVLKEEATWAGTHVQNAVKYLHKMSKIAKKEISRAYSKLFERNLNTDIVDAICAGDEYYEQLGI